MFAKMFPHDTVCAFLISGIMVSYAHSQYLANLQVSMVTNCSSDIFSCGLHMAFNTGVTDSVLVMDRWMAGLFIMGVV
jgi:hypothetical protein